MGQRRRNLSAAVLLLVLHLLLLFSAPGTCTPARGRGGVAPTKGEEDGYSWFWATAARRALVGPGSSPPTCRSSCRGCHPCRPVHVAIQPGRSFPLEYYPEAWRCKCGNKLFMP
ncbi:EPIDERMAL PATTERNING FACTOR-like protein 4 [Zea mays]|uniref:Epidermal patterning factor-like protein n=1 Tax=Zea mays TaxID=4577 RepID=K7VLY8_MAIZE|nr:EPIDERMAL PATTERNING FACTOR-like protein 4 [Zea mays]AQL09725.1 EPIDERMAL PATTERNING FACTOR-like protein 4 [Zea mays]|eukprot:XP_008660533.1 EPIDERMAL PATTERNING FACTOR-like protein 4 [Zea mays]